MVVIHSCFNDYYSPVPKPIPKEAKPTESLEAHFVSEAPDKISNPYWATADYLQVLLQDVNTQGLYPDGLLNSTSTFNGLSDFNSGDSVNLRLKAAYDDEKLYILVEWNDDDKNASRYSLLFNGPEDKKKPAESTSGWTAQRNDDQMALAFNISSSDFTNDGCQAACHNDGMNTISGLVDIWNWSLALSEPLGYAIDMNCTSDQGLIQDQGTSMYSSNIQNDDYRSGPIYFWDGIDQKLDKPNGVANKLDPGFYILENHKAPFLGDPAKARSLYVKECGETCHGVDGEGYGPDLDGPPFIKPGSMNKYTRTSFEDYGRSDEHSGNAAFAGLTPEEIDDLLALVRGFSGVPAYILQEPSGSNADIHASSNVITARVTPGGIRYKVLLIRNLTTGNSDDVQFDPKTTSSYPFGIALMDADGINHIGSLKETLLFVNP